MAIKDLLVQVDGSASSGPRLEWALTVAERYSAQVTAMAMVPEPYLPALVGVHIPVELLREQAAEADRAADAVLAHAGELGRRSGRSVATTRIRAPIERLPALFARAARRADLCVVGQPNPDSVEFDTTLLAEAAFMDSGRPAVILPYAGTPSPLVRRVLIAWNGSREATRAVHDALPFLAGAQATTLLIVDPAAQESAATGMPGADIAAHLSRHGVHVEVRTVSSAGLAVGDVILGQAADEGADLLVMGGYGHSRMREMVLGGATRQLLAQMTLPVLLSH